jgi:hypothetical protein
MNPDLNPSDVEVTEIVSGELDVVAGGRRYRVLIPAGVGVPGLADDDLAGGLVAELLARGSELPDVIDVTSVLRNRPEVLEAVAARVDREG